MIFEKALQMQMQPKSKLTADLGNRSKKKPFGKVNIFQYQCKVMGCKFRTRRVRLMDHYVRQHDMKEIEAEKLVPPRFDTTAKMDKVQCPRCRLEVAPLFLRRHIFQRYFFRSESKVDFLKTDMYFPVIVKVLQLKRQI